MKIAILASVITLASFASAAGAVTFYTDAMPTGEIASPGSTSYTFAGPIKSGTLSFELAGYRTLDGVNCCTDTFTLNLNGTDIFSGAFALGGNGVNTIFFAPAGATYTATQFGFFQGGIATLYVPLTLAAGTNTLTFTYSGLNQGLGDEGWGLQNVVVTSNAVPEPATLLMLGGGFALLGAAKRRRTA